MPSASSASAIAASLPLAAKKKIFPSSVTCHLEKPVPKAPQFGLSSLNSSRSTPEKNKSDIRNEVSDTVTTHNVANQQSQTNVPSNSSSSDFEKGSLLMDVLNHSKINIGVRKND